MEWAKRELQSIQGPNVGMWDHVVSNIHGGLGKIGVLKNANGELTVVGGVLNDMLGHTVQQRSKATLQRTFDYLLTTLEENIAKWDSLQFDTTHAVLSMWGRGRYISIITSMGDMKLCGRFLLALAADVGSRKFRGGSQSFSFRDA